MKLFNQVYQGCDVLITGHNGFKGSWLSLWLNKMGANVTGISLPLTDDNQHFSQLQLGLNEYDVDIRDFDAVHKIFQETKPEIVFHLAAQSLVRPSYADPLETWSTNVMGTANVLEACRKSDSVKAVVVITSDKCYENKEWQWGYRENDRLGGHDPYSASKAGVELVAKSFRKSYFETSANVLLATARAGNVIGGGDWSLDRLIPDAARAVKQKKEMLVRSPNAIRPWQHVLEPLSGYLMLGEKLLSRKSEFAAAWNFGPDEQGNRTVKEMLMRLQHNWQSLRFSIADEPQLHEAGLLKLDSSNARNNLKWQPVWKWEENIDATASWYNTYLFNDKIVTESQLEAYITDAHRLDCEWVKL